MYLPKAGRIFPEARPRCGDHQDPPPCKLAVQGVGLARCYFVFGL